MYKSMGDDPPPLPIVVDPVGNQGQSVEEGAVAQGGDSVDLGLIFFRIGLNVCEYLMIFL